jgi:hypothetical protein
MRPGAFDHDQIKHEIARLTADRLGSGHLLGVLAAIGRMRQQAHCVH